MEREKEDPRGRTLPPGYLKRPVLAPENQFFWDAFWDLTTERQQPDGMGAPAGPIPLSAISAYADRYGVHGLDEFDSFKNLIRAMDGVWREKAEGVTPLDMEAVKGIVRSHAKEKDSPDG